MTAGMVPMALGWSEGGEQTAPLGPGRHRRPGRGDPRDPDRAADRLRARPGRAGRESASLDPDDPASTHYHEEEAEASEMARPSANGEPQVLQPQGPADDPSAAGHNPRG